MTFKVFLRLLICLAILFVMLYIGMYNTHPIHFSFPMALQHDLYQPAAYIFFAVFAIGVLGGAVLTAGGGKGGRSRGGSKDK